MCLWSKTLTDIELLLLFISGFITFNCGFQNVCMYICIVHMYVCTYVSLSTVVLNSRDRQGMYGMQHFCAPINKPHNSL